ncbi:MAG: WYL domain-containing protein [Vulcanimicrobiaceae bacterium]
MLERGERILARIAFPSMDVALYQTLAWGERVTIVEPEALRQAILSRAREAIARYAP